MLHTSRFRITEFSTTTPHFTTEKREPKNLKWKLHNYHAISSWNHEPKKSQPHPQKTKGIGAVWPGDDLSDLWVKPLDTVTMQYSHKRERNKKGKENDNRGQARSPLLCSSTPTIAGRCSDRITHIYMMCLRTMQY